MDSKLIKHKAFPKALLLKDFLLDDMSSCSSNGFSSFPRKQCCATTVRFLIEIDLKNIKQPKKYFIFNKKKHKPSKFPISAFHTAVAAVKRLPFSAAGGSPEKTNTLMKFLKKSVFWKRKPSFDEIGRWKSLDQLMKEGPQSLGIPKSSITAAEAAATMTNDRGNSSSSEVNLSSTEVERNNDNDGGDDDNEEVVMKDGDVSADSTTSSDGGATRSSTKFNRAPALLLLTTPSPPPPSAPAHRRRRRLPQPTAAVCPSPPAHCRRLGEWWHRLCCLVKNN